MTVKHTSLTVLRRCTSLLNEDGSLTQLDEVKTAEMMDTITSMAKRVCEVSCALDH
jgi:hypothetical protein